MLHKPLAPRTCDSFIADVDSTKTCQELEDSYGVNCYGCVCPDTALRCPRSVVNRTSGLRLNCDEMIEMHPSTIDDVQFAFVPTCAWLEDNVKMRCDGCACADRSACMRVNLGPAEPGEVFTGVLRDGQKLQNCDDLQADANTFTCAKIEEQTKGGVSCDGCQPVMILQGTFLD